MITCGKYNVIAMELSVPQRGVWSANLTFDGAAPNINGKVLIVVDGVSFSGTVVVVQNGVYVGQRQCTVLGGAGAWSLYLPSKGYHNDAGVRANIVAQDLARESGEVLGTFAPSTSKENLGVDFVRDSTTQASGVLESIIGLGVPWFVGFDGVTRVGVRESFAVNDKSYDVLDYNPRKREATLAVNTLVDVARIGGLINKLPNEAGLSRAIKSFTLSVTQESMRLVALFADDLSDITRAIVERINDKKLFCKYRYRVVSQSNADGRLSLQAVLAQAGLPDTTLIDVWPGVAGAYAKLTPGTIVLVEFIEGNRALPIVTGFASSNTSGFVPIALALGGTDGPFAARVGDTVVCDITTPLDGTSVSGGLVTIPAVSPVSGLQQKVTGTITTGSLKVKIA